MRKIRTVHRQSEEIHSFERLSLEKFENYPRHVVRWVLDHHTLNSVYQAVMRHETGEIFGYEALSRPYFEQTMLRPDFWFQLAYKHDLGFHADVVAIQNALRNFPLSNNPRNLLFINVMPSSFIHKEFIPVFRDLLKQSHILTEQVILELVEYSLASHVQLRESIEQMHSIGIRVALDDLGTGLSNLNRLVELKPDLVKLDRSLIQGIASSPERQRLLSLFVAYMNNPESVIAEGIETREDLEVVIQSGVQLSQGFYWGYPSSL